MFVMISVSRAQLLQDTPEGFHVFLLHHKHVCIIYIYIISSTLRILLLKIQETLELHITWLQLALVYITHIIVLS